MNELNQQEKSYSLSNLFILAITLQYLGLRDPPGTLGHEHVLHTPGWQSASKL